MCYQFNQTGLWYISYIQKCNHCYEIWWWNLYARITWLTSQLLSDCILPKWTTRKKQGIKQNWCWNKIEMSLCRTRLVALWKLSYLIEFSKLFTESIAFWQLFLEACPVHPSQAEIEFWKHDYHFTHSTQYWKSHEKLFIILFLKYSLQRLLKVYVSQYVLNGEFTKPN